MWKSKFYGAFVLNRRVDLHAIDATPNRWRGGAGSSPLVSTQVAFSFVTTDAIPLPDLDAENIRVDRPDRVFVREDEIGWRDFYDDLEPFEPVDHELLPMVFEDTRATNLPAPGGKQSLLNAARAAGANI